MPWGIFFRSIHPCTVAQKRKYVRSPSHSGKLRCRPRDGGSDNRPVECPVARPFLETISPQLTYAISCDSLGARREAQRIESSLASKRTLAFRAEKRWLEFQHIILR